MRVSTAGYLLGTFVLLTLMYLLYKQQHKHITAEDVYLQPPGSGNRAGELKGLFSEERHRVVYEQGFQPMVIPNEGNASFDYKAAMEKLNSAKVEADDPRLIKLIRDYYIIPPSKQPYNLDNPERLEYSNGQTPFIDSRLNYMVC